MHAVALFLLALGQLVENPDPTAHSPVKGAKLYTSPGELGGFRTFDAMNRVYLGMLSPEGKAADGATEAIRLVNEGQRVAFEDAVPVRVFASYCQPSMYADVVRWCPDVRRLPKEFVCEVVVVRAEVLEGEHKGKQLYFDADALYSMVTQAQADAITKRLEKAESQPPKQSRAERMREARKREEAERLGRLIAK